MDDNDFTSDRWQKLIKETEETPSMEVHLGEQVTTDEGEEYGRFVIIWVNGKRWQGILTRVDE